MRGYAGLIFILIAALACTVSGCRTSTVSGLPEHIQTVEIHIFENKTMYKGLEGTVTRRLIDRVNGDPRIRVVSSGGDAILTGEITNVLHTTLRETSTNDPSTRMVTIEATYSLYDEKERRYIIEDAKVTSADTGMSRGIYDLPRGGSQEDAERSASAALADEIVRRTIAMW